MASQPLLSIRDLKVSFPTREGIVPAVDGVSFDVLPGQTVGVVGESGCGKSTVGRSILQILDRPGRVDHGQILWHTATAGGAESVIDIAAQDPNGQLMRSLRGGEIALVFQEPMTSFSPVHTVGNQILEKILLHAEMTRPEALEWSVELFDMVGIPNPRQRLGEHAYQLSGGLRQRAMIAMAISSEPRLLIADEPTTALDVTTQAQILELLRSLQQQHNMAVILITHNLGVVAEMADAVVVMYLGRGVESGPVRAMFHDPQHPYTRGLLRSMPSMEGQRGELLPSIAGTIPSPFNRPPGCPFHPRCEAVMEGVCEVHVPRYQPLHGTEQMVSCFLHHAPDVAGEPAAAPVGSSAARAGEAHGTDAVPESSGDG